MSIYSILNKQSNEEAELNTDTDEVTITVSFEEDEDHQEALDMIEDVQGDITEASSLEDFTESMADYAELTENASNEEITPLLADAFTAHANATQRIVTAAGGPDLGLKTYSAEDFKLSNDHRQAIAKNSSESAWASVKTAFLKFVEYVKNMGKKIVEMVVRFMNNTDKLKSKAKAIKEKVAKGFSPRTEEKSSIGALEINGKFDPEAAVKSFSKDLGISKYVDITEAAETKVLNKLLAASQEKKALEKAVDEASVPETKSAAKEIVHIGGNVVIGETNGVLWAKDVPGSKAKVKALGGIGAVNSLMTAVIETENGFDSMKKTIESVNKDLDKLLASVVSANERLKDESYLGNKYRQLTTKLSHRAVARAAIGVLQRIASRQYLACTAAISYAEWSTSAKAPKK